VLPLAVDAYTAGAYVGTLLPLLAGVVLVVLGVRRRRPAPPPHEGASWGDDVGGDASPPRPADPRGGARLIVAGAMLVALALVAGLVQGVGREHERGVRLPTAVLGLQRDQAASEAIRDQALANVPDELIDPQAALYGQLPRAVLVIAAKARTVRPATQVEGFRAGLERSGGALRNGRDVDAGTLGGKARCWEATISGVNPGVCVFVDRGSLVATIDFLGGELTAAAQRGLQVREATVSER
jgi:hypothetical protein